RDSAAEVLAAWLHAADLAEQDIDELLSWLRQPDDPTPARILRDDPTAEASAAVNLNRHLDPAAARTTSGVLRYLTLALNGLATAQRKYNIGYVYGVQTASQEDTVYGPDAPALRAAAGVSIIGGIDVDSARELADRAGSTPVVTPTHGVDLHHEYIQVQDALTV